MERRLQVDAIELLASAARRPSRAPGDARSGYSPDLGAAALAVVERLAAGLVLLGCNDRVLYLNGSAKRIVDARDGVDLYDGRLKATVPEGDRVLQSVLGRSGGCAAIPRPSGASPYIIQVATNRSRNEAVTCFPGPDLKTVLIIDSDPAVDVHEYEDAFREIWGLTPAEARVASALLAGLTPAEIGARTGVSRNTVRIHIYSIFNKVGVRRQVDLIRTLTMLTGFSIKVR